MVLESFAEGISIAGIASAEQSSNSRVMRVKTELTRTARTTKFATRNNINPRRMADRVYGGEGGGGGIQVWGDVWS